MPDEKNKHESKLANETELRCINPVVTHKTSGSDQPTIDSVKEVDVEKLLDTEQDVDVLSESKLSPSIFKPSVGYLWHARLGHAFTNYAKKFQKKTELSKNVIFDENIKIVMSACSRT